MQKSTRFFVILFLFCSLTLSAKSWFVDNRPGATVKDFTSLSDAITAAAPGDTIMLAGSPWDYASSNLSITKNVVIIGPGYFLSDNFPGVSVQYTAMLGSIEFNAGASGAQVSGCTIVNGCSVNANNIGIFRNQIGCTINIQTSITDVLIKGNFCSTSPYCIIIGNNCFNILVQNNYLHSRSGYEIINMPGSSGVMLSNNVIDLINNSNGLTTYNSVFSNNIFVCVYSNPIATYTNEFYNNISNNNNLPSGNSNVNNVDISTVFQMNGSVDGYYKLKPGSPAIGAGQNGIDAGMYGGMAPYVLSGISSLPKIYSLEILNLTPQALTARVKAGATLNQSIPGKSGNIDNTKPNIMPSANTIK